MARVVSDYLEEIVKKFPDKTAYADGQRTLTFAQTRDEALHVAQRLLDLGLFKAPAAVFLDKKVECIPAMLGAAYSGNFYTMIDTQMPVSRIQKICDTLEPRAVITDEAHVETVKEFAGNAEILVYEELQKGNISEQEILAAADRILPSDVLYVLFTSGSTGMPKGVVTSHRALIGYIDGASKAYGFSEKDVFGNQVPFYFVMSIVDIYGTLRNGATMHVIPHIHFMFPALLMKSIAEKKITTVYWVPSALCMLPNMKALDLEDISCMKKIIFSGEVMPIRQLNMWMDRLPEAMFANAYGPTEVTDAATYYIVNRRFEETARLPIGIPFENYDVLVLDENGKRLEKEGMGELCVRSSCLAYGYYRDPEKTAEVFIQNPLNDAYEEKVYKTGDLVQFNEYGELEYAGRKDFQIKHMGRRIELGEIEANASSVEGLEENCCLYDQEKQHIIMYYSGKLDDEEFGKKLKKLLPDYMMPHERYHLEQMPHNLNGKIDRAELKKRMMER